MIALRYLLCSTILVLTGCKEPLTRDRFGRTAEVGPQPEALTLKELSFLVRAQTPESEILAELTRRGLAEPIDDTSRRLLIEAGAPARFIEALGASPSILTEEERVLYTQRVAARKNAAAVAASDHDRWVEDSRADVSRKVYTAESARLDEKRRELNSKVAKLRAERSRETYSRSSSSPYQGYERKIAEVKAEIDQISSEIERLRQAAGR